MDVPLPNYRTEMAKLCFLTKRERYSKLIVLAMDALENQDV